jgi:hypothetical protein
MERFFPTAPLRDLVHSGSLIQFPVFLHINVLILCILRLSFPLLLLYWLPIPHATPILNPIDRLQC